VGPVAHAGRLAPGLLPPLVSTQAHRRRGTFRHSACTTVALRSSPGLTRLVLPTLTRRSASAVGSARPSRTADSPTAATTAGVVSDGGRASGAMLEVDQTARPPCRVASPILHVAPVGLAGPRSAADEDHGLVGASPVVDVLCTSPSSARFGRRTMRYVRASRLRRLLSFSGASIRAERSRTGPSRTSRRSQRTWSLRRRRPRRNWRLAPPRPSRTRSRSSSVAACRQMSRVAVLGSPACS
jgi:hypothetical protein